MKSGDYQIRRKVGVNSEQRRAYRNAYRKANAAKESARCKAWREANPEKARDACNRWRMNNQEHLLNQAREYSKIGVIDLSDNYVKKVIIKDTERKRSEVTQSEVDLKREYLMFFRLLNQLKRAVNGTN